METQVGMYAKQKIISTKLSTNYSIIFQDGKLLGILEDGVAGNVLYYFDAEEKQPKVTTDILENALKALLNTNSAGFDILYACFYGLKQQEEYFSIATKVFKERWNELYNLVIADDIFQRESALSETDVTYDFFAEN